MTDSNLNILKNDEDENENKEQEEINNEQVIETPKTDALFQTNRFTGPFSGFDQAMFRNNARVVDFFDNRFLGDQRSFEEILENRSNIALEAQQKNKEIQAELKKTIPSQIIRGAITGVPRAINETVEFADDIYDYLAGNPYDNNDLIDYSYFEDEDDGIFYQIPQAITQFLLPMGIFSKSLKGIKNPWTRNLIAGFITDFIVEDPYEQNLYNMIDSYEGFLEPVVDILKMPASVFKADGDISPIEARLRKAFGGAILGEVITGLSIALKAFRNSSVAPKILQTLEAKRKLKFKDLGIDQAGNELLDAKITDIIDKKFLDEINIDAATKNIEDVKTVLGDQSDEILEQGDKIKSTFNPDLTGGGIDSLREYLLNMSEHIRDLDELNQWTRSVSLGDMYAAASRQSGGEAIEAARFLIREFGPYIKTKTGKIIDNPKYLPSTTISINQMMNRNGAEMYNLSVGLHNAIITKNIDAIKQIRKEFIEESKILRGLVYLNKGVSSLLGQSLGARRIAGDLRDVPTTAKDFGKKTRRTNLEDIDEINRNFIEDTGVNEIDETFNKIFDLVEKGDEEAALALTRLTSYLSNAGGNPEVLKALVRKGLVLRGAELTNEIFINSILSGPETHIVNILSTGLNTLVKPLSQSLGAGKVVFRKDQNIGFFQSMLRARENLIIKPEFNNVEFRKGWKQFIYMADAFGEAMTIAKNAFRANENMLDRAAMVSDVKRVSRRIDAEDVRKFANQNEVTKTIVKPFVDLFIADAYIPSIYNIFRDINGFGSRMLITEDEFYKQVNFRSYVKSEAWESGINKGLKGSDLTDYINKQSQKVFRLAETGSTRKMPQSIVDLYKRAKDYAAEVTFTKDLKRDSLGGRIQDLGKHPMGRFIVPFVRTPLNILKTQIRYTPAVNLFMQEYRQALRSTDASVAARARGEMYIGGMFGASIATLVLQQDDPFADIAFTGGGPNLMGFGDQTRANRDLVKQMKEEGWQPYAVRFLVRDTNGDVVLTKSGKPKYRYISYKRLDPWSGILMLVADIAEIHGQVDDDQRVGLITAVTTAIAKNLSDRTYLGGIAEFTEAMNNPFKLSTLLARRAANIVNPLAGLGRSLTQMQDTTKLDTTFYPADPTVSSVRAFLNEIARTVPFYNSNLEPDRNWLTGAIVKYPVGFGPDTFNVINPLTSTTTKDNFVLSIINDLGIALQPPRKYFFNNNSSTGIQLDQQQYSDYVQHLAFDVKGLYIIGDSGQKEFKVDSSGDRLIVALYRELDKDMNKALYKIAMGEYIDSTNQDFSVAKQVSAKEELQKLITGIVEDYKLVARDLWLSKPENVELYTKYVKFLNELNHSYNGDLYKSYQSIINPKSQ